MTTALELLGLSLIVLGLYLWWPPLALVVGGAGLVGLAILIERERAARHDDSTTDSSGV